MEHVIIGVDPHKLSATIEVVDEREQLLGSGRFTTDRAGYAAMRKYAEGWPERVWAVEGSNGAGRPLAQRLLEDGEHVVDVPAKLAARVRLFDTGHNRKTDARDAHAVAVVAVRTKTLRVLQLDGELEALRMLIDRREALTRRGSRPSTGSRRCSPNCFQGRRNATSPPARPRRCSPSVRPRDIAGKTRRRIAAEELAELIAVEAKIKKATAELKAIVLARGSHLMDLHGVGRSWPPGSWPTSATSPGSPTATASPPGPAPHPRRLLRRAEPPPLSRAGNRRMNHMIHIAAISQIRLDTDGRAYYRRKRAEGKKPLEAIRCLKRRISDAIYRQLLADAQAAQAAWHGPGRALRGDSRIQRGRPAPAHRHFGSATSRTRATRRYARPVDNRREPV